MKRITLAAFAAFAVAWLCSPVLAQEIVERSAKTVTVPWGDWLAATASTITQIMLPILLPAAAAFLANELHKVSPMAGMLLSQKRVEMMLQAGADYGLNAVQGAAKGRKIAFPVGIDVLRIGTQYLIDTAPQRVIDEAGGPEGIAQRLFRKIDLEDAADEGNTLIPVMDWLRSTGLASGAKPVRRR